MPSAPFVVPPLLLIATLVVSAVAKVRDPSDTSSVFVQLALPRILLRLRVPRLLPYAELVLAAGVLVAPDRWYAVAATAALLLFAAYFLVIWRALRLPYPVSCACFGRLGLGEVSRWTLVRNGLLLALALVTWVDSWRADGVVQRLGSGSTATWSLAGLALLVPAALLVARARRTTVPHDGLDADAYRPVPFPDGELRGPDGAHSVWDLSAEAARLLVFCDPARDRGLVERAVVWATRLAPVRVHVVTALTLADPSAGPVLTDPGDAFRSRLGVASPGAVLLGTDRMLAGGPAAGPREIEDLVEAVAAELGLTRSSPP